MTVCSATKRRLHSALRAADRDIEEARSLPVYDNESRDERLDALAGTVSALSDVVLEVISYLTEDDEDWSC